MTQCQKLQGKLKTFDKYFLIIKCEMFRTRGGLEITPVDDDKKDQAGGSFLDKLGFQKRKVSRQAASRIDLGQ